MQFILSLRLFTFVFSLCSFSFSIHIIYEHCYVHHLCRCLLLTTLCVVVVVYSRAMSRPRSLNQKSTVYEDSLLHSVPNSVLNSVFNTLLISVLNTLLNFLLNSPLNSTQFSLNFSSEFSTQFSLQFSPQFSSEFSTQLSRVLYSFSNYIIIVTILPDMFIKYFVMFCTLKSLA